MVMLGQYKVAVQIARRRPLDVGAAFFQLVLGLLCLLVVQALIRHEFRFDTGFLRANEVVRVAFTPKDPSATWFPKYALTPLPLSSLLAENKADLGIDDLSHVRKGEVVVGVRDFAVRQEAIFVEPGFFRIFDYDVASDHPTMVGEPNTVVISDTLAGMLPGGTGPDGLALEVNGTLHKVVGVVRKPAFPTSLWADVFVTVAVSQNHSHQSWTNWLGPIFIAQAAHWNPQELRKAIEERVAAWAPDTVKDIIGRLEVAVEPLEDLRLWSGLEAFPDEPAGSAMFTVYMAGIGAVIILLTTANFANIVSGISLQRRAEIGLRRALGATRPRLVAQFASELVLYAVGALLVAMALFEFLMPRIASHLDIEATGTFRIDSVTIAIGVIALAVLVMVGASIMTSTVRSAIPSDTSRRLDNAGPRTLTRLVVGAQVALAVALSITVVVGIDQLRFAVGGDLGFDHENKIIIEEMGGHFTTAHAGRLASAFDQESFVRGAALANSIPGMPGRRLRDLSVPGTDGPPVRADTYFADPSMPALLGLRLLAGRYFDPGRSTERDWVVSDDGRRRAVALLSQAAAETLGMTDPTLALNRTIHLEDSGTVIELLVVGVVADVQSHGARNRANPSVFIAGRGGRNAAFLLLDVVPSMSPQLEEVDRVWRGILPEVPPKSGFLDEHIKAKYRQDERLFFLLGVLVMVSLLLSGLGLIALARQETYRRRREIAIRRVLGSSVPDLVTLFLKGLFKVIGVSALLGLVGAAYLSRYWLEGFVYRIELTTMHFVGPVALLFLLAAATVSGQILNAVRRPPVDCLKGD